ncbi:hypothetical protein Bbelb_093520 [Branchiostoma belcheri]|nr:hypothetical protein Bbelb_093520 [Branchiostoma belcheri]
MDAALPPYDLFGDYLYSATCGPTHLQIPARRRGTSERPRQTTDEGQRRQPGCHGRRVNQINSLDLNFLNSAGVGHEIKVVPRHHHDPVPLSDPPPPTSPAHSLELLCLAVCGPQYEHANVRAPTVEPAILGYPLKAAPPTHRHTSTPSLEPAIRGNPLKAGTGLSAAYHPTIGTSTPFLSLLFAQIFLRDKTVNWAVIAPLELHLPPTGTQGTRPVACQDSNPGPLDSESSSLPLRHTTPGASVFGIVTR